jgi:hypothetical protein
MKTKSLVIVMLIVFGGATAGQDDEAVKREMKRFEGDWKVISLKWRGNEDLLKDERDAEAVYTFKSNKFFVKMREEKEPSKGLIAW